MKKFSQNFYKSFSIIETLKKKKREKILFPLIFLFDIFILFSYRTNYKLPTPDRYNNSFARTRVRASSFLLHNIYTTQSFRDLSRALFYSNHASINLGRELGGCLLSLLSLVVPRNLGRREESWGRTIEEKLYSGLFGEGNSFSFPGYRE